MQFLGRNRELERLTQGCEAAIQSRGGLYLLVGEPGIGKTRLAEEVAAMAAKRGLVVAWGRAWETGGAPPYYPWVEVLEALGGAAAGAPSLDESRPIRGESVGPDSAHERFTHFERVSAFLRQRCRQQPSLLIFDDLHAADLPSLDLLHFVSRNLRTRRIAVIGTFRDLEAQRAPIAEHLARLGREATLMPLGALGNDDVAKLVEAHTGRADDALTSQLVAKTEGNPLFVAEALRMLEQSSFAPSSVWALVASRIDGLEPRTLELLDAASVFGRRIELAPLANATNTPLLELVRHCDQLCSRGVLRESGDGSYAFSHALVREVFYERIAPGRRRELHAALGMTLVNAGSKQTALAAHHLLAAVPFVEAAQLVQVTIAAAEAARARLAPEDAVTLLERAHASLDGLAAAESERIELLLALGWAATEAGTLARGRQVFGEASKRAASTGDARLIARAALGQGAELVFGEVREELIASLRSALAGLSGSLDLQARLLARLAAALQPSPTPEEPVALARQALRMAEQVTEPRVRAEIALAAGSALTDFAPPAERIPVAEELARTARSLDDAILELRGLTRLATDWLELGDFLKAESVIDARAELAARIGHPRYLWQTPLLRSMLAMPRGAFKQCDEAIEEAQAIAQEGLDPNAAHVLAMHRFWLLLMRGDHEGLRAHTPDMLQAMRRMPEPAQHYALVHAVVDARSDRAVQARRALAGMGQAERLLAPMMQVTIADAALLAEDTARFADLLAKLTPASGRNTAWGPFGFVCGPPYDTTLGSLAARLGQRQEALTYFNSALELAQRCDAPASEAWVRLARAEAWRAWSEPSAEEFALAARLARTHGMPAVLARAEIEGEPAPPPPARPSSPPAVTTAALPQFSLRITDKEAIIVADGRTTRLRLVRGLPMLALLLDNPGRELHALDLAAEPDPDGAIADGGDAGEVLDVKAREAYQGRIRELRVEIEEGERCADAPRADRARRELDLLVQQLSSAVGMGGRARRLGSAAERARIVVQRRIREAIKKIGEHEHELARHLDWAIRTGTFCAYEPRGRKTAH
jgi:hypothetical protein